MSYFTDTRHVLPDGVFPTMITPMNDDQSVDWAGVDMLTEWYIRSGVAGIFTVCWSSEMYQLTNEERVAIAKRVSDKAAGRVPVVAGATFEGGLEQQAELMNKMAEHVDTVVIITNQIGDMSDSDEIWMANVEKLMDLTGDKPLGIYETPIPKVRSLTPSMMEWAARSGRFVFHKETSLMASTMIDKIKAVKSVSNTPFKMSLLLQESESLGGEVEVKPRTSVNNNDILRVQWDITCLYPKGLSQSVLLLWNNRIYTAIGPLLKVCMDNGGNGFSGVTPNFFPWLISWICENRSDQTGHLDQAIRFTSIVDGTVQRKYPTSAKCYLAQEYGAPLKPVSRVTSDVITDQDAMSLHCVREEMERVCKDIGIVPVDITSCQ